MTGPQTFTVLHNRRTGEDFQVAAAVLDFLIDNKWIGPVTFQ